MARGAKWPGVKILSNMIVYDYEQLLLIQQKLNSIAETVIHYKTSQHNLFVNFKQHN